MKMVAQTLDSARGNNMDIVLKGSWLCVLTYPVAPGEISSGVYLSLSTPVHFGAFSVLKSGGNIKLCISFGKQFRSCSKN